MPAVALTDTGNLFAALEFSETHGQGRHPADHGLPARARPRRAGASRRPRAGAAAGRAAGPGRDGLRQPDEALLDSTTSTAAPRCRTSRSTRSPPTPTGLICLTGGAEGPLGRLIRDGQPPRARALAERAGRALPRPALRRDPAPPRERRRRARRPRRRPSPASSGSPTTLDLPLVATNDVHFADRGDARRPRRADLHRRRRLRRPAGAAPPADARALLQVRRTRWRRSSPTCRRRWRTRSRSPAAAPSGRGSASRSCRASPRTRSRSCAGQARAGLAARLAVIPHVGAATRTTARGSSSSSASSRAWASPATS